MQPIKVVPPPPPAQPSLPQQTLQSAAVSEQPERNEQAANGRGMHRQGPVTIRGLRFHVGGRPSPRAQWTFLPMAIEGDGVISAPCHRVLAEGDISLQEA